MVGEVLGVEKSKEMVWMKRDIAAMGGSRPHHDKEGRRPIWRGPVPDRYYYIVRNLQAGPASWMVPYSDVRSDIRQVATIQGGHRSLIETLKPMYLPSNVGKLLAHGKVERIRKILRESMDHFSHDLSDSDGGPLEIKGREIKDGEIFI